MPTFGCPANGISIVGREDAHLEVVRWVARLADEARLGVVELARDALHRVRVQPVRVEDDGERVAAEALVGEDVERDVVEAHRALP